MKNDKYNMFSFCLPVDIEIEIKKWKIGITLNQITDKIALICSRFRIDRINVFVFLFIFLNSHFSFYT